MICNSYRIIESVHLTETVLPVKNWVDKVLEWNPCNLRKKSTQKPSTEVYISGNIMIMHPDTATVLMRYGV